MRKRLTSLGIALASIPFVAFPQAVVISGGGATPSAGDVANNLTQASVIFSGLMANLFYIIGIALVVASIIQYREHRNNSSQTPISRPIVLFIAGLVIGFLPLMAQYMSNATSAYRV